MPLHRLTSASFSEPRLGSPLSSLRRRCGGFTALESLVLLVILVLFSVILAGIGKRWLAEGGKLPETKFGEPSPASVSTGTTDPASPSAPPQPAAR